MSKKDKKILKMRERIAELENALLTSLTKKTSDTPEISVSEYTRKIKEAKEQLNKYMGVV